MQISKASCSKIRRRHFLNAVWHYVEQIGTQINGWLILNKHSPLVLYVADGSGIQSLDSRWPGPCKWKRSEILKKVINGWISNLIHHAHKHWAVWQSTHTHSWNYCINMSNFPNAILSGFWIRTMCNIAYLVLGLNNLRRLSVKFRYDRAKLFGFSGMATMTQPYFCFFSLFMFNPLLILTSLLQSCVSSGTSEIVGPRKPYVLKKRKRNKTRLFLRPNLVVFLVKETQHSS